MLFLVISTPVPTRPSAVQDQRRKYWPWAQDKLDRGLAKSFYAPDRAGCRCAVFDVDSNETLHGLLDEWAEIVPAEFDIYPLIDADAIKSFLGGEAD